jgi:hypothetical protein
VGASGEHFEWHTAGFQPAQPGWRCVFLDAGGGIYTTDLPGWLIEEQVLYGPTGYPRFEHEQPTRPNRRVIAAGEERGCLYPVTDLDDGGAFWYVLGPKEADPPLHLARAEHARRTQLHEQTTTTTGGATS